jgi:proliferating cell nuclear antigen
MAEAKSELQFMALTRTAEVWKSISSAIMTIVDEAHFEANKEGLQFRSMDPSHIVLIDISCPAVAFEKYECPSSVKFGFRVNDFAKVMKRAGSNDSVELGLQDDMLNIKTSGSYNRNYKLRLIGTSSGSGTPLPKLQFDSKLVMAPSILDKILSDIEVVANNITIETTEKEEVICSTRGDSGDATITLDDKNGVENLHEISITKPSKSTYSSEFMSKMVKAVGAFSEKVTAEFTSKMPLKLSFDLPNAVKIQFFMAPRVED